MWYFILGYKFSGININQLIYILLGASQLFLLQHLDHDIL